jgi:hypothetical protein
MGEMEKLLFLIGKKWEEKADKSFLCGGCDISVTPKKVPKSIPPSP